MATAGFTHAAVQRPVDPPEPGDAPLRDRGGQRRERGERGGEREGQRRERERERVCVCVGPCESVSVHTRVFDHA